MAQEEGGTRLGAEANKSPLVSIIVVVFRDRAEVDALIDNLAPFRGPDLEVVFIDGGSDDGTVDLLRQRDASVDYWLSERDNGIYDAMNKGVQAARGEWLLHINAGDRLLSVPYDLLSGMDAGISIVGCNVECPNDHFTFIARMNWSFRYQATLHHQGTFYRRAFHTGYDATYRVLGDTAATQRMVFAGGKVAVSSDVVSVHIGGGLSDLPGNDAEWDRIVRENSGLFHHFVFKRLFLPVRRWHRDRSRKKRLPG